MSGRLLAAVLVFVSGCATSAPHAASTVGPSVAASGVPVTSSPTQGGTRSPEPSTSPVTKVAFSCRLPVITYESGGDGITYQGGFITFPAGTYAADPNGAINSVYQQGGFVTKQAPVLHGVIDSSASPFFDAGIGRWVPSGAGEASPDGSAYAYATIGASSSDGAVIHVVDVSSGVEKTYAWAAIPNVGAVSGVQVVDFDGARGVYLVVNQVEAWPVGVWRLDLTTGKVTALARVGNVLGVSHGSAWSGAVDPHDPNPPRVPASRFLFDSIVQVNLATGESTPWYYTPGRSEFVLGLSTAGWPIVNISDGPDYPAYGGEVRLVPEPHVDGESNGELVSNGPVVSNPRTDGDRTWFGSDSGIYLYTSGGGLQKVFAFTPKPSTSRTMSPAGFCR